MATAARVTFGLCRVALNRQIDVTEYVDCNFTSIRATRANVRLPGRSEIR